mmetsp:Transcript_26115/g.66313  ORF Transcript_26115/g.66313 Transcript_26115/m.66313 type:complete len:224 (+) Transcript_26115:245-916(+)
MRLRRHGHALRVRLRVGHVTALVRLARQLRSGSTAVVHGRVLVRRIYRVRVLTEGQGWLLAVGRAIVCLATAPLLGRCGRGHVCERERFTIVVRLVVGVVRRVRLAAVSRGQVVVHRRRAAPGRLLVRRTALREAVRELLLRKHAVRRRGLHGAALARVRVGRDGACVRWRVPQRDSRLVPAAAVVRLRRRAGTSGGEGVCQHGHRHSRNRRRADASECGRVI